VLDFVLDHREFSQLGRISLKVATGHGLVERGANGPMHPEVAAELAFGLVRLAVAAGFEPTEGWPSRAFEFCGWWFRPVRLGLVAPEPSLRSPLRTPLNLHE
jgi:hypothetical protein